MQIFDTLAERARMRAIQSFPEYPKMLYGPNGEQVTVNDADEESDALAGWEPVQEASGDPSSADDSPLVSNALTEKRGPGRPRKITQDE